MSNELNSMTIITASPLTEDEEAAILAEYGVTGPYDELLDLPQDSKFRSEVSGLNVFLTGAGIEEEDKKAPETLLSKDEDLVHMPLRSLLIKHTSVFQSSSPELLHRTVQTMNQLDNRQGSFSDLPKEKTAEGNDGKYLKEIAQAKAKLKGLYRQYAGSFRSSEEDVVLFDLDDDHEHITNRSDALLSEADRFLRSRKHFDPATDELFKKQIELQKVLNRAEGIDEVDDFLEKEALLTEDDTEAILKKVNETQRKVQHLLAESGVKPVEKADLPAFSNAEKSDELLSRLESLFSYEFESTRQEKQQLLEWDSVIQQAEDASAVMLPSNETFTENTFTENVSSLFAPLKAFRKEALQESSEEPKLEDVENILEVRDNYVEGVAEKDVTVSIKQHFQLREELQSQRKMTQVKLQPFETVVNQLIPPAEIELQLPEAEVLNAEYTELKASTGAEKAANDPFKSLVRASQLQLRLMEREQKEFALMRAEDDRMHRVIREVAEKVETIQEWMEECVKKYDEVRMDIEGGEKSDWESIKKRRSDHLALTLKTIQLREFHTSVEKANEELHQFQMILDEIKRDESAQFNKFLREKEEDRQEVIKRMDAKARAELEAKMKKISSLKDQFISVKKKAKEVGDLSEGSSVATSVRFSLLSSRVLLLFQEQLQCRYWWNSEVKALRATEKKLLESIAVSKSFKALPHKLSRNERAPTTEGLVHEDSCLSEDSLPRLIPLTMDAVQKDPQRAPHYFHTLSLPLENLTSIDYGSLSKVVLPSSPTGKDMTRLVGREMSMSELVREIDLSNNSLQVVHVMDLLETFPFLKKVQLANNGMTSLTDYRCPVRPSSMRGVTAAQENAAAERVRVEDLDLSSNNVDNLGVVGKFLSSSLRVLVAHNNQLNYLQPLMTCLKVERLSLSKNKIESVDPLAPMLVLRELDAADNNITSVESIAKHNLFIEKLFLSRNPLSQLPSRKYVFLFLHQLFLNDCGLQSLQWDAMPWMPCLSILHVDRNKIRCVSGISRCSRLTDLRIAYNNLQTWKDLNPLTFCSRLTVLDVSGNPFFGAFEERPPISGVDRSTSKAQFPPALESALISVLPALRELNNTTVPSPQCAEFLRDRSNRACFSTHHLTWRARVTLRELSDNATVYNRVMATLSSDIALGNLRNAADVFEIRGKQSFRAAAALEDELRKRLADSKRDYLPSVHRLSHLVEEQYRRERLRCLHQALNHFDASTTKDHSNVHIVFSSYAQKALANKEKRAKTIIAEWIYGRLLIRKAVAQLKVLREEFRKSENYRFGEAAKVIQRIGRGAIIRNRLRCVKQDDLDGDEDDLLAGLDFDLVEPPSEDFRAIVGHVFQKVQPQTKERFQVPETLSLLQKGGVPASDRAGSAPDGATGAPRIDDHKNGRPSTGTTTLEEQWGDGVAQSIRKMNMKRQKEQRKVKREEFIKDPLKGKRDKRK